MGLEKYREKVEDGKQCSGYTNLLVVAMGLKPKKVPMHLLKIITNPRLEEER